VLHIGGIAQPAPHGFTLNLSARDTVRKAVSSKPPAQQLPVMTDAPVCGSL
jgi:hypothetical protein